MIKTRFAPSPTGFMHLGSAKAALFPYLFAKRNNGSFLLRIDDTDRERSREEYVRDIFASLEYLQIFPDFCIAQSDRQDIYENIFQDLKTRGIVYPCYETPEDLEDIQNAKRLKKKLLFQKDDRRVFQGKEYWRFQISQEKFFFTDEIFGEMRSIRSWSDPVIRRPDGSYTYMFTSVVDDVQEGITSIIRGSEHINNTFLQIAMAEAILSNPWKIKFAHFPLFLNEERHKLSKREGDLSLHELKKDFENWTLWSVLSHLGSNTSQIYSSSLQDYVASFDLQSFSRSPQIFSSNILMKTQKKIFTSLSLSEIMIEQSSLPESILKLLQTCASSPEQMRLLIRKMESFSVKSHELLKNTKTLEDLVAYVKLHDLNLKQEMIKIYEDILGMQFGPPLKDLLPLLHEF